MRQISLAAMMAVALATISIVPVVSANTVVEDAVDRLACHNTGSQGTITKVPYFVWVDGAYWIGSYYYVDSTISYQNVDRYNYCIANIQVGAVSTSYGGSSSRHTCVNCVVIGVELA